MTALESWLAVYLLNSLWQVPLIFAAAWLATRIAKASGSALQHRIWVAALILQFASPAFALPSTGIFHNIWHSIRLVFRTTSTGQQTRVTVITGDGYAHGTLGIQPKLLLMLAALYFAATVYFVCRLAWSLWRSYALLHKTSAVISPDMRQRFAHYAALYSIPDAELASSPTIHGPVTLGIRHRVLLLPAGFGISLNAADIDAAFAHEFAHIQRGDFAKNLFYELISLPIAFHPLVRLTLRQLAATREMVCDAIAARSVDGPEPYAKSLLRLAAVCIPPTPAANLHAIGIFDAHNFERRIMELTTKRIELRRPHRMALAAVCMTLGLATCASALTLHVNLAVPAMKRQSPHGPARISGGVMAGQILTKVTPVYPAEAKAAGISGSVVMHAIIGEDGTVQQLTVVSGPPELQPAAMDAVRQWTYKPYLLNGNPVAVDTIITVNFNLAP